MDLAAIGPPKSAGYRPTMQSILGGPLAAKGIARRRAVEGALQYADTVCMAFKGKMFGSPGLRLFLIFVFAPVLDARADFSAALGPEFSAAFEKTARTRSALYAPGAAVSVFIIEDSSWLGLFAHFSFLFPVSLTKDISGASETVDLDFYDVITQIGIIVGPGVRLDMNSALRLNAGLGVGALATIASSRKEHPLYNNYHYSLFSFNLGVAGVVEMSLETLSPFYMAFGVSVSYDLQNYISVSSRTQNARGWAAEYSMLSARPYICFGYRFNDIEAGD